MAAALVTPLFERIGVHNERVPAQKQPAWSVTSYSQIMLSSGSEQETHP